MKALRLLPAAIAALVVLAGCDSININNSINPNSIKGSGNEKSEPRTISSFTSVKLKGNGQLLIDENGTESLVVTTDENLLPYVTTEVSGGELIIDTKDSANLNPTKNIVYKLTVKDIHAIDLAGSGTVDAKGIKTERLKIMLGGSGNISAAGTADQQEVTIAGSGDYQGGNLKSNDVTVNIMGSGGVVLAAAKKLDATIMGSGSIKYAGDAVVTQHILGSGSIEKQ
jgi:Putative auto-transporter adhesin, head GIN domain